ncbi:hypothetical protein PGT21_020307 [Puccinia graminis f. sp. tritici]|uniref:Uncharacterized protein n=1 Tax=Puccinia graminis f. sp. tritici TaxID=56615 RepID=A0A5B0M2P7_PUCGR|nr:hypothetical protein PGT21_020307 [Puccinia graminis f. sp. tritici]
MLYSMQARFYTMQPCVTPPEPQLDPSINRPSPRPRLKVQGNSRLGRDRPLTYSLFFLKSHTNTTNTTMLDPLLQQQATPPAQESSTLPVNPLQVQSKRPCASPIEEVNRKNEKEQLVVIQFFFLS